MAFVVSPSEKGKGKVQLVKCHAQMPKLPQAEARHVTWGDTNSHNTEIV